MPAHLQDTVKLNNGVHIPWFGLGVWKVKEGDEVVLSVKNAIRHGYRSIDTAAAYQNEEGVGQGIAEALQENNLKREELFITTKVWNADQGYESTLQALETSLTKLGLDYVDLYLIHWPVKGKYKETWKALEQLYKDGKAKAIGVCNFHVHHLEDLAEGSEITPALNQVELHPYLTQQELREYCAKKGIQIEAWSPLAQGKIVEDKTIQAIGDKYGKSAAQVVLRWDLQHGIVTIPKSVREERIVANADIFDFELTAEDVAAIDALNQDERTGPDPDNFNF
ncbi:diketogulonate reductase-like aldo/keto reductase [Paenibacillus shirakamiensis]|uniref:Diketogulonate reductase-like aldo/keto reductase n=1 Tax=Paenibacillus shirakamiensis TaxID=1265935 RepID=A0ABS4JK22_9BACL|nr:aldo/keto reductase [Paenibacillus shirakamiensis]MBP2000954.1 diketogulonate reductase-like aldo/keto reductase [Paenibacillus shirakamiensis]